jgi:hypothetical protein
VDAKLLQDLRAQHAPSARPQAFNQDAGTSCLMPADRSWAWSRMLGANEILFGREI